MNALNIAIKDLRIFFKDRGAVIQLFLLPLLFVVIFSGALTAMGSGGKEDTRTLLPVVDLDGGQAAQTLLDGLNAAGGVRVERYEQAEAMALLQERKLARVLTIPANFSSDFGADRQMTLRLVNHPDANSEETEAVRLVIEGVAQDMSLESQILASLRRMGEMQASAPEEQQQAFASERTMAQARSQFERSRTQPLVELVQMLPEREGEREEMPDAVQLAVPGFTVMFVFLTAQATARSIYDEKKIGSFRRLLAAPMSKASLLAGKMLPNFVTGLVQTAVIFAFGTIGMRLIGLTPMTLGNAPLIVALVAVLVALCSSTFGILIAAIARTENQIGGLSAVVLWGMGILGGSFIPLFFLEGFLGPLPQIVPHYWANSAFNDLLVRGLGLADVTLEIAMLLAFTVLFFVVGLWRFDFD
ncbi:MAG: ABC transporter permease [Chloroflexota bacterium]|nr:ABC transporter permease [Chloroflexota bacterium]